MDRILVNLRTLLLDHLANSQPLTADASLGATSVKVSNTSRFRPGDQVLIMPTSASVTVAEKSVVKSLVDFETLDLEAPTTRAWLVSEGAHVLKAVGHNPIKRIHVGDLRVIPSFPTITLEPTDEDNEWFTLRSTTHDFKISIRTYVMADNFEDSTLLLPKLSQQIREVLLDHIHPIIDGVNIPITADVPVGATVISVTDTSKIRPRDAVFLRDATPRPSSEELTVKTILSPTEFEAFTPTEFDYEVARSAEAILITRYLYDTRPSSVSYGFAPGSGGSLMRASEISWYGKEQVIREGNILT